MASRFRRELKRARKVGVDLDGADWRRYDALPSDLKFQPHVDADPFHLEEMASEARTGELGLDRPGREPAALEEDSRVRGREYRDLVLCVMSPNAKTG